MNAVPELQVCVVGTLQSVPIEKHEFHSGNGGDVGGGEGGGGDGGGGEGYGGGGEGNGGGCGGISPPPHAQHITVAEKFDES